MSDHSYNSTRVRADTVVSDEMIAELTRLRAKVAAADKLAEVLCRADNAICNCDGPLCFSCQRQRLALDAALSAYADLARASIAQAAELTSLRAKVEALTEVLHNAYSHQLAACAEWEGEMSKARGAASQKLAAARYAGHYSAANDLAKRIAEVLGKGDAG